MHDNNSENETEPKRRGFNRRSILRGIGGSAVGLSAASVLSSEASAESSEVNGHTDQYSGGKKQSILNEARSTDEFTNRESDARRLGFEVLDSEAIAAGLYGDGDHKEDSVAVPLESSNIDPDIWTGVDVQEKINHTVGFITWQSTTASAQVVLLGVTSEDIDAATVIDDSHDENLEIVDNQNVVSVKIILEDDTFTDSMVSNRDESVELGSKSTQAGTNAVSAASESVRRCVADNLGLLGISDGIVTCGGCIFPGNGFGVGDILECFYCAGQSLTDICVVGYCQRKNGGNTGDLFCDAAEAVEVTPLYLLPGGPPPFVNSLGAAASYGCSNNVDEATDCTSPVIP